MAYNPNIHNRRSIRIKGYDYSQTGAYFITICCQDRKHRFGKVEKGEMKLNELGTIAYDEWVKLPNRFHNFELDVFQIMPNHMHGIIILNDFPCSQEPVRTGFTPVPNEIYNSNERISDPNERISYSNEKISDPIETNIKDEDKNEKGDFKNINRGLNRDEDQDRAAARVAPTVGGIVGAYKSLVANQCLDIFKLKNKTMGKLWQRNYYENIIRNERAYNNIAAYIINNPKKWDEDKFYKKE